MHTLACASATPHACVTHHILEHALGVAFEALGQLLRLVRIVMHVGGRGGPIYAARSVEGQAHIWRHILIVPHVDRHSLALGVRAHLLELRHRRRSRLL